MDETPRQWDADTYLKTLKGQDEAAALTMLTFDLRNRLNVALTHTELLRDHFKGKSPVGLTQQQILAYLEEVRTAHRHMANILSALSEYAPDPED